MEQLQEHLTVPLIMLVGGVIAWCIWLTLRLLSAEKDIAVNTTNDYSVKNEIRDVKEKVSEVKTDVNSRIDKFEDHVTRQFDKVFMLIERISK